MQTGTGTQPFPFLVLSIPVQNCNLNSLEFFFELSTWRQGEHAVYLFCIYHVTTMYLALILHSLNIAQILTKYPVNWAQELMKLLGVEVTMCLLWCLEYNNGNGSIFLNCYTVQGSLHILSHSLFILKMASHTDNIVELVYRLGWSVSQDGQSLVYLPFFLPLYIFFPVLLLGQISEPFWFS